MKFNAGDSDVVLGTLVYNIEGADNVAVNRDEYVLVRGDFTNSGTDLESDAQWIEDVMKNIEIRDIFTGRTIEGRPWSGWLGREESAETFIFKNVSATDDGHWEFLVDSSVFIPEGARFRIEVVSQFNDWDPIAVGEWHIVASV